MTSILKVSEIQDPTNSNTALTIDASGNAKIPGSVVQVLRSKGTNSRYTVSSSSWIEPDTNMYVNITPKFSSSILIAQLQGHVQIANTSFGGLIPTVTVGATTVSMIEEQNASGGSADPFAGGSTGMNEMFRDTSTGNQWWTFNLSGLYQCTSTAQHTVKMYGRVGGGALTVGDSGPAIQLIVYEIAQQE